MSPGNQANIIAALESAVSLICYFGHGDEHSWIAGGAAMVGAADFSIAAKKAVVSIACNTGCNLGPDAVTSGVEAWLGFTINVAGIRLEPRSSPACLL